MSAPRTSWRDRPVTWQMVAGFAALLVALPLAASCTVEAVSAPAPTGPVTPTPVSTLTRRDTQILKVQVDGRTVTCIYIDGHLEGALSCDWSAKQ